MDNKNTDKQEGFAYKLSQNETCRDCGTEFETLETKYNHILNLHKNFCPEC